ncbi:MAG: hypothetical protein HDR23_04735 [Lachnospiraceae bacterium]|nr:hypothetical protein [Lachnospiraceae bacterium]
MNGDIDGFQIGAGVGAGLDVHLVEAHTYEIWKYNDFDFWLNLLNKESECD